MRPVQFAADHAEIRPASVADQAQILTLMRRVPVLTPVESYRMEREPNPFALQAFQGRDSQLLVAEDAQQLLGLISLNIDRLWLDGEPRLLAYSSELRVLPEARGRGLGEALQRASLEACRQNGETIPLFNTVMHSNPVGMRMNRYLGLEAISEIQTCFWPTGLAPRHANSSIRRARPADVAEMAALWAECAPKRQLTRVYAPSEWGRADCFPPAQHWLLAQSGSEIVGFVGIWDQRALRQIQLETAGLALRLIGWRPGLALPLAHCLHLCLRPSARRILPDLLLAALGLARTLGARLLSLALDAQDPLREWLPRTPGSFGRMSLCASKRPLRPKPFQLEMSLG